MAKRRGPKLKFIVNEKFLKDVSVLAGYGLTQEQLRDYYEISKTQWFILKKKHKKLETVINQGKAQGVSYVSGKLMEQVRKGNLGAIIFYLKTQARWSEHSSLSIENDEKEKRVTKLEITTNDPVEAAKVYTQIMAMTGS
jgi:hypothetical protein